MTQLADRLEKTMQLRQCIFFSLLQGDKNIVCLASSPSRLIVFYDKTYYENYKSPIQLCSRQLVNRGT